MRLTGALCLFVLPRPSAIAVAEGPGAPIATYGTIDIDGNLADWTPLAGPDPAPWQSPAGYTVSAIIFGLTAWSIPSIVAAASGDYMGSRLAPAALGFVTLFFGLGQAAGPSVAGTIADMTGSFGPAFLAAAGVAFLGGVGSLLMRPPRTAAGV